jgi:hypothetical protein
MPSPALALAVFGRAVPNPLKKPIKAPERISGTMPGTIPSQAFIAAAMSMPL